MEVKMKNRKFLNFVFCPLNFELNFKSVVIRENPWLKMFFVLSFKSASIRG